MDISISEEVTEEYIKDVKDILSNKEFLRLNHYTHHHWTTRLMHSLNVSYISWLIARKLNCDARSVARAGLLHDFCLYDFKDGTPTGEFQAFYHPKFAARSSAELFEISDLERDAILSHMFPLGPLPKSKEAWIITMADKFCASVELCHVAIALARRNRITIIRA